MSRLHDDSMHALFGRAMAVTFARQEALLALVDVDAGGLQGTVNLAKKEKAEIIAITADVRCESSFVTGQALPVDGGLTLDNFSDRSVIIEVN